MVNENFQNLKTREKLPPQAIEAEKSLLGALMLEKTAIYKVADFLKTRDFYKKIHQDIYQAMIELFERGEPIDILTVGTRLSEKNLLESSGGNSYLTDLVNSVATASHVLDYAKIVQKKRILRDLIGASHDIEVMGHNEIEDIDTLLDRAEQRIFSIAQQSLTHDFVLVKDTLEEAFERIDALSKQKGTPRGLPTGFNALDNILAGLQKSDLIILASRPAFGKSSLATNFAANIAITQKVPVGIFSLEMSRDQIVDRLISSQSGVDLWRLRTGRLSSEGENNDFIRIQRALGVLSEAPIFIDDAASADILQMRAMARRLQARKGLGLIVVDYLQLMESRNPIFSMVQQMTEISRSLKGLARELNVPVLALSQLSRAVERRVPSIPRLADLRESGCVTGDTLIMRADTGQRTPIKDLVGQKDIPIHSLDEDWKIKEMKISKVFSSGRKMVYKLTTRTGFKIKVSANHKFRKLDGWYRLDQLKMGDFVATPRKVSLSKPQNDMKDEEIILLAHLLGDGCVLPNQPVHYTSGDWQNIQIVAETAKKLFNIKPRIVKQENWWHVYLPAPYRLARGKYHPITNWYRDLGIERVRSFKKEISQKIFSLDKQKIALFLRHLWATDGNISSKYLMGRKPSANIYYSSTSPEMIEGVKHLLLRFGVRSRISKVKKADYRFCYHLAIQGKEDQVKFLEKIGCYGKRAKIIPKLIGYLERIEPNTNVDIIPKQVWAGIINETRQAKRISWREFSAGIETAYCGSSLFKNGIGLARMERVATFLESQKLLNVAQSDVFWDQVVSIESLGVEKVYDATVSKTHNFVANDIILHNSLEQDSDVVLFIYREDRYRLDTDRKNIADIIIAKHRNGPVGKVELYFDEKTVSFRTLEKQIEE